MKLLSLSTCFLLLFSCAHQKVEPTAEQKVKDLEIMCDNASKEITERQKKKSFYECLGKDDGIRQFVNNLYDSHVDNPQISHMFKDLDKGPFVNRVSRFLAAGTGGKTKYEGRSMKVVHQDMNISNQDFLEVKKDVDMVMKEMNYGDNEIQEMVCALVSFVPVVVTQR